MMRMKRKQWISALICLTILLLAGCGGAPSSDGGPVKIDFDSTPSPGSAGGTANPSAGNPSAGASSGSAAPIAQPSAQPTPTPDNSDLDGIPDPKETPVPKRTLKEYQSTNQDVIGWIKIPNTKIDYPITRTDTNDFYLRNNVDKKTSKAGAIFMDYRNASADQQQHLIVYGHNMRDGSMFHDLNKYKDKNFFDKNKTITMTLDGREEKFEVYAAFIVEVEKTRYIDTKFDSDISFAVYMNDLSLLSKFDPGARVDPDDQVLTLSTCTYEYDKSRFVVQAKRVTES